jgi:hypothetical protein
VNPEFSGINMFYPGRWSLPPDSCRSSEKSKAADTMSNGEFFQEQQEHSLIKALTG